MGTTERNVLIGIGVLGIAAIAYEMFSTKPAAANTTPVIPGAPATPIVPTNPSQTATGTNFNDTPFTGNTGQTIAMTAGDTVSVDLPVPSGAASFNYSATGSSLTAGTPIADSTQYMQVWTATPGSAGTSSTVSFQAIAADNTTLIGTPVSFTAVVS